MQVRLCKKKKKNPQYMKSCITCVLNVWVWSPNLLMLGKILEANQNSNIRSCLMASIQIRYNGLKRESCLIQTGTSCAFHNMLLMFSPMESVPLAVWKTWKCWIFWMTNIATDQEGKNKRHLLPLQHTHTTLTAVTIKTGRLLWKCLRQKVASSITEKS